MKYTDKVEIKTEEKVSEYDGKTYTDFEFVIHELFGYGAVLFDPPLIVKGSIEKGGDIAHYYYDFGMDDEVSVKKDKNFLYNYGDINSNKECDPVQTVLNTVKFDLQHAFNHIDMDPNFGHVHWALRSCLAERTTSFDWFDEDELDEHMQLLKQCKPKPQDKLNRYVDENGDNQKWGKISKIIVPTTEDKEQLLLASEYIHNLRDLDTDYMMPNMVAHLYEHPELIEVQKES